MTIFELQRYALFPKQQKVCLRTISALPLLYRFHKSFISFSPPSTYTKMSIV